MMFCIRTSKIEKDKKERYRQILQAILEGNGKSWFIAKKFKSCKCE